MRTLDAEDLAGRELGDYRILRRIGAGGMAEVYLAEQRSLGREIALKVLPRSLARDAGFVERFRREARAAASLIHANIVQIFEVGQIDGLHYIAQEFVRGKNLAEVLRRESTLPPRLVLDILRQVTAALVKAAELGIVHRDVKPENILLSASGEAKVADFGLARVESVQGQALTQTGVTLGTPLYMSPEQIEGRPLDSRSDVYSLGVTAYHLLAGVPPHVGEAALAIALKHLNVEPTPLERLVSGVPPALSRLVAKMMAKRPEDRFASAAELQQQLWQLGTEAAAGGWGEPLDPWAHWSWLGGTGSSQLTARLGEVMQQSAKLELPSPWRRRAWTFAATLAVGLAAAAALRPRPLLDAGRQAVKVEKLTDPWAQLAHANLSPSEASWRAVAEHHPDAEPYILELAALGMVRYHLFLSKDMERARDALDSWPRSSDDAVDPSPLWDFRRAADCIISSRLGDRQRALAAAEQLGERKELLKSADPDLYELLARSLDELPAAP